MSADDVLHLEWKATGGGRKIEDGIDTFIFQDGLIRVQTVVYTVQRLTTRSMVGRRCRTRQIRSLSDGSAQVGTAPDHAIE